MGGGSLRCGKRRLDQGQSMACSTTRRGLDAEHVVEDREKMHLLLNRKTFEPALPYMPMAPVMAMVATDVAGHPPLHERAEGGLGSRLHDQVKMIGHETHAEEFDGVLRFRGGEQVEECCVVTVLGKTVAPPFPRFSTW